MTKTLQKTYLAFDAGILTIYFLDNTIIDVEDVIYIFCYGFEKSHGKPYAVLFNSASKHELTEEAIAYLANSSYLQQVIAIAYISKDLISKIRLSLLLIFERPLVRPKLFNDETKALHWLEKQLEAHSYSHI